MYGYTLYIYKDDRFNKRAPPKSGKYARTRVEVLYDETNAPRATNRVVEIFVSRSVYVALYMCEYICAYTYARVYVRTQI